MSNIYLIFFFTLVFGVQQILAQEVLTLERAKEIALDNNYNAQISQHSLRLVENNTRLIKAGRKPTFSLSAGINGNISNSITKRFSIPEKIEAFWAPSFSSNLSASGQLLLWDGGNIDQKTMQNEVAIEQANISLEATKQDIIFQLKSLYLNILELLEREALLMESIEISSKRKLRSQYAVEYGQGSQLELLNATVDLNRDSLDLIKFQQQVINLKRNLNLLLNRDINTAYQLEAKQNLDITSALSLEVYKSNALTHNLDISQAKASLNISSYDQTINDSALKPRIFATTSYGVNYLNNSEPNFNDYSLSDGLNLGLSASWTIGDGGRTKILNENVAINLMQQTLILNQVRDRTLMNITNSWGDYQNALLLYRLEQSNVTTAIENFDRTQEQFKQGLINSITFRQAQLNLLNTNLSLATAKYDVILLVLDLELLSGMIE